MARSLSAIALAAATLVVLLCATQSEAKAKTFTVGGRGLSPWGFGVMTWKPSAPIHKGDFLKFSWKGIPHDVWLMNNVDAYNNCNFSAAKKKTGITSFGSYMYKVTSTASPLYFSCSVIGHCKADNMKVAIPITA
ncbi:hypothetical protein CLOM_g9374 [Closterium sp. NIES-68]|nr:hypothetical protein CLOM_g9374 [Closterium sp. NIES-68]GJP63615.1 hypothetical protein CLOP_g20685 [Closterium sp. NIES-67]